jgi:hypothetical protein
MAEVKKTLAGKFTTTPPVLTAFRQCATTLPESAQNIRRVLMDRDVTYHNTFNKEFVDMARNSKISVNSSDPIETKITKEESARQICKTYLDQFNERKKNINDDNFIGFIEASFDVRFCMASNLCANELLERMDIGFMKSFTSEATTRCMNNLPRSLE